MKLVNLMTKEQRKQLDDELIGLRGRKEINNGHLSNHDLLTVTMIQTMLKLADLEEAVIEIQKTLSEKCQS